MRGYARLPIREFTVDEIVEAVNKDLVTVECEIHGAFYSFIARMKQDDTVKAEQTP